jgi:ribonuclease BN (tRNA processing enzyme)
MKVRILPSAFGAAQDYQYLTSFLVGGTIAIDAGCLGLSSASGALMKLRHVFITHAHLDHVGTLPIFLESGHNQGGGPLQVYGPREALDVLRTNLLNDQVWVDYARLAKGDGACLELHPLESEQPVGLDGLKVTAVAVDHTVPTFGYLVDDGSCAVAFGADSGPTQRIWEIARATDHLRAAFLECSFPNAFDTLAAKTGHLTPSLWIGELSKLPPETTVVAVHIKPRYRERVIAELEALGHGRTWIGRADHEYVW